MRSPSARPASLRGSAVLGSVNWAFVICLFLLLGFVFMWFTATDERDKVKSDNTKLAEESARRLREGLAVAQELDRTAKLLGFNTKSVTFNGESFSAVDRDMALAHLSTTGEVELTSDDGTNTKTKVPGMLNVLRNHLKVTIPVAVRSGDGTPKENVKEVDFSWASQGFRAKLKQASEELRAIPAQPSEPADKDDAEAMAKYRADLDKYTRAVEAYNASMEAAMGGDFKADWKRFKETISGTPFDPDASKAVELNFGPKIVGNEVSSFQQLMLLFPAPYNAILSEFKANKEADEQARVRLQGESKAKEDEIAAQKTRYAELQKAMEDKVQQDKTEIERLTGVNSGLDAEKTKAVADLNKMSEERKREVSKLTAEKRALQQRVESDKEQADLEIQRDEVDGRLLAMDMRMETGTIDLGSAARAYPGLKFVVSYVDRGGARQSVGEVQVIKVTGPNSSQVRLVSAAQPLVSGNLISNPLFNASRDIHIYCLDWAPDVIEKARLAEMHVIVDERPSADTDWFVVPDAWKAGGAAPAEGAEPAAAGSNPLDKAKQEALTFGAKVITHRMLEAFLKL